MKRMLARIATLAVAAVLPVAITASAASAEEVTVTGCFGAGTNDTIVCDLTVTAERPQPAVGIVYVKVCSGTCQDVPVQWVNPGTDTAALCVTYKDGWGGSRGFCSDDSVLGPNVGSLKPLVLDLFDCGSGLFCVHE